MICSQVLKLLSLVAVSSWTPAVVPAASQHAGPISWGEITIGMTLKEADALRTDDHVDECGYVSAHLCLVRSDIAFGRKADVVARVDDGSGRISAITVSITEFSRKRGYPCALVAGQVFEHLQHAYGEPACDSKYSILTHCSWNFANGSQLDYLSMCFTHDPTVGKVQVTFGGAKPGM